MADMGYGDFTPLRKDQEMTSGNHNTVILDRVDNVAHLFYTSRGKEQSERLIDYLEKGDYLIGREMAKLVVDYCLRRTN